MNQRKINVGVLGAGRLAEVLTRLLEVADSAKIRLWARRADARGAFAKAHPAVEVCDSVGPVAGPADVVFFTVPSTAIEEVADLYGPYARGDQVVIHASRGVSDGFRLPHQLIRGKTCVRKLVAIGGPLHSRELTTGRILPAAVASRFEEGIQAVRELTQGTPIRVHPSSDLIGVEVANAISNVTALASGMSEALELGDTARGLLLTRGLAEAQRLGVALGAEAPTFAGIAGLGDLIPRRVSSTDRHHAVGARVARGERLSRALEEAGGVVEGVVTAKEAAAMAERLGLKLPLIEAVDRALRQEAEARAAIEALLHLDLDDLLTTPSRRAV
ncbi:MAG: NAD(P)-binding domain-containing protein [Deltaproteobacteria bacterium]|nr:NAD(P)-binding domain-containing protein [Deltaproteobacteria bacterium]